MRLSPFHLLTIALALTLLSCSAPRYTTRPAGVSPTSPLAGEGADQAGDEHRIDAPRMPWELWGLGRDLEGAEIANTSLIRGDEYSRAGQRQPALIEYQRALTEGLSPAERSAAAMRIAGTMISIDKAREALSFLAGYFKQQHVDVEQVDLRFSLLFGYAYGRARDLDQSLAWISRARGLVSPESGFLTLSSEAVKNVLAAIPEERFEGTAEAWSEDTFIAPLIAQERARRRAQPELVASVGLAPFEQYFRPASAVTGTPMIAAQSTVAVFLPLEKPFADLGAGVKNGIELAVAGLSQDGSPAPTVVYEDSGSSPVDTATRVRKALSGGDGVAAELILGPLLAENADVVRSIAQENRVPILAFSKRADFVTGDGVFRLAPTVESQISSLVARIKEEPSLRRIGVVYPDDPSGREAASLFVKEWRAAAGRSVVLQLAYPKEDDAALLQIAKELEGHYLDGIFLPDSLIRAGHLFSSLSEGVRQKIRPLGLGLWDNHQELLNSASALEGAIFVSLFPVSTPTPLIAQFTDAYRQKYGRAPDFLAAQGFDAASMALTALREAKASGENFNQTFSRISGYQGLTGEISVQSNGELSRKYAVLEVRRGAIQNLPPKSDPVMPTLSPAGAY